jgi:pimeloyl-ACP methyl ester carboxylesterase
VPSRYIAVFISLLVSLLLLAACAKAPPAAVTGSVASADGIPIKYESVGRGGPALVFIHCWTCKRGFWDDQAAYFSDRYQVVRLDLGGHGESGLGRKVYSMSAFGADVAAVVDRLGLQQVVLIGHSMGGPVALEAEKRLGSRVIGVVGVDTFHTGFDYPKGAKVTEFVKPFENDFPATADKFIRSMFPPTADKALVERLARYFAAGNKQVAVSAMQQILVWYEHDSASAFARVGNRLRNINADHKGDNKPLHASVVLIPGVGHFVAQEKPAEFNRVLDEMIKQFAAGAGKI